MKSRSSLFIGLITAVIAAAVSLWRTRTSDDSQVPPPAAPSASRAAEPAAPPPPAAAPRTAEAPAPAAGDAHGAEAHEPGEPRDHRGETPSIPRPHRPGDKAVYVVQAPVIAQVRAALRPAIKVCSDQFAQDLEPKAQIQGSLVVTIRSGVLSVLDVTVQHSGVPESSPLIECARKAFAAVELRTDGHADVESHTLRFPFKVPVK